MRRHHRHQIRWRPFRRRVVLLLEQRSWMLYPLPQQSCRHMLFVQSEQQSSQAASENVRVRSQHWTSCQLKPKQTQPMSQPALRGPHDTCKHRRVARAGIDCVAAACRMVTYPIPTGCIRVLYVENAVRGTNTRTLFYGALYTVRKNHTHVHVRADSSRRERGRRARPASGMRKAL